MRNSNHDPKTCSCIRCAIDRYEHKWTNFEQIVLQRLENAYLNPSAVSHPSPLEMIVRK